MILLHFSWRALQVLTLQRVDADMLTLCGSMHPNRDYWTGGGGDPEGHEVITEARMDGAVATMATNLIPTEYNKARVEFPTWVADQPQRPIIYNGVSYGTGPAVHRCLDCLELVDDLESSLLVALDREQELGHRLAPFSRRPGERPIDLLVQWLRDEGPQRRSEVERFLWARAHPRENDEIEVYDSGSDRFSIHRQSIGFWSTNFRGLLNRGILVLTDEGYAAP